MTHLDLRLLYLLNHLAGRSAELDSALRFIAVWGPLWAAWEVARPWILDGDSRRGARVLRDAFLSALVAFVFCIVLMHLRPRSRPFLSLPVTLLYLPPNDASFPDMVSAIGAAVTLGAIRRSRDRWLPAGSFLFVWIFARMASGALFPFDAATGALIGAAPAFAESLIDRIPAPKWAARTGATALAVCIAVSLWMLHHSKPKLPIQSPTNENMTAALASGPVDPVYDPRLKGFMPEEESAALQSMLSVFPPPPVSKVEIGADEKIMVAGVKLWAGSHWNQRAAFITEWQAARTLRALLTNRPELAEIDLWAVVPFKTPHGKEALRPVFFVQTRRSKGARLKKATDWEILSDPSGLLKSAGSIFTLEKEFPVPGQTLPNGVEEGAG